MTSMDVEASKIHVKLGMAITNFHFDQASGKLFVEGPAIEEGVWTGMDGKARFFPREVLRAGSNLFSGVPLVCEHKGNEIGQVVKTEPTELGFNITEAYLTNPASIEAVMSGEKTGFSIEGSISMDPIRNIVERILSADNISLVGNPACKVCGISNMHFVDNNHEGISMTDAQIEEEAVKSVDVSQNDVETEQPDIMLSTSITEPKGVTGVLQKFETLFDKFATLFVKAQAEKQAVALSTDNESEQPVEQVVEPVVEPVVEQVVEPVVEQVVEQVVEPEAEPVVEQADQTDQIEQATELDEEIQMSAEDRISQIENSMGSIAEAMNHILETLNRFDTETIAMSAQIDALKVEKVELSAQEKDTVEKLVAEIVAIDSKSDVEVLKTMTVTQLGAYKAKVESLLKPTVGATKMSAPRDASIVPAETKKYVTREDLILALAETLKKNQR